MPSNETDLGPAVRQTAQAFRAAYGKTPTVAASAPGRVNLIGEHTDYNDGLVLPLAIERRSLLLATPRDDTTVRLKSTQLPGEAVLDLRTPLKPGDPPWSNYLRGVIARWTEADPLTHGFDILIDSSVPIGGGLSSSASMTVGMATLLEALTATQLDPIKKARAAQWAENTFAGTPCGIMDPFASTFAQPGHAMMIDCRTLEVTHVALPNNLAILITNSNRPHELVGGEYAQRRAQCASAANKFGVSSLRDATLPMLNDARDRLTGTEMKRARHVITENTRVLDVVQALRKRDWPTIGQCFYDSHASMRDDFEITTPELDTLVDLAAAIGPDQGVIGARMTGGGFGGCTVTLAHTACAQAITEQLAEGYKTATGIDATLFTTRPAEGARILDPSELPA